VTQLAIVETLWLLRRSFGWKRDQQIRFLTSLLDSPVFELENRFDFEEAADRFLFGKVEFPDCLIEVASERAGVDTIHTFDGKAADRRLFTCLRSKG
jgi:predicted nucleic-acid-binding protein